MADGRTTRALKGGIAYPPPIKEQGPWRLNYTIYTIYIYFRVDVSSPSMCGYQFHLETQEPAALSLRGYNTSQSSTQRSVYTYAKGHEYYYYVSCKSIRRRRRMKKKRIRRNDNGPKIADERAPKAIFPISDSWYANNRINNLGKTRVVYIEGTLWSPEMLFFFLTQINYRYIYIYSLCEENICYVN